ncbi:MAG: SIMPL domain-containing protein [Myxococcota bacterium]
MRLLSFLFAVLATTACQHARAADPEGHRPTGGLQTTGVGTWEAEPDLAVLMMGVSVERARSAAQARTEAATAMAALVQRLLGLGIPDRDLKTTSIRIDADYRFEDRVRRLVGYRADMRIEVRVRELDRVGEFIDRGMAAIGDRGRLDGLRFELANPAAAQSEARAAAVAAARASAEELAKALGVKMGPAMEVIELSGAQGVPTPSSGVQLRAMAESSTPVSPGTLSVRVVVQVRWALAN